MPRAAVADVQGAIQDDFLTLSSAYLESHRHLLRPKAPIPFVAEFLARWVSTTVHGFAMHSPGELDGDHLVNELVDAVPVGGQRRGLGARAASAITYTFMSVMERMTDQYSIAEARVTSLHWYARRKPGRPSS